MNTKIIIAAVTLLISAGSSFANSTDGALPEVAFTSTLSRSQVQQELAAAQAHGQIATGDRYDAQQASITSNKARSEVRAEAISYAKMQRTNPMHNDYLGG